MTRRRALTLAGLSLAALAAGAFALGYGVAKGEWR